MTTLRNRRSALRAGSLAAAILIAGLTPAAARADSLRVGASLDNTLFESTTGDVSNGSGPVFFAGSNSSLNRRRGVIAFDVAGIVPEDAVVDSVALTLHVSNAQNEIPRRIALHRVTAAWGEGASSSSGGSGAASAAGDATWIHRFFPDQAWSAPGGDFDPGVRSERDVAGVGFYTWSGDSLAADVRAWIADPESNFGWILIGEEETASTARRFDSRENPGDAMRPVLTVYYSGDTPVTPATWGGIKAGEAR